MRRHTFYHCRAERELQVDGAVSAIAGIFVEIYLVFTWRAVHTAARRAAADVTQNAEKGGNSREPEIASLVC
jgi:hypothetical protein